MKLTRFIIGRLGARSEPGSLRPVDPEEELAQRRVGTMIGAWRLERMLGVGGMASVFEGRRSDGVVAAVKLLHEYLASYDEVRLRFLREGPIGSALAAVGPLCQGLPQVYESGVAQDGTSYMAMELLDGETIATRLSKLGPMAPGQALWVAQQVLDVLVVAHAYDIIHRDIKPENLLLLATGGLKVLDFGVAKVLSALPDGSLLPDKTRTKTGAIIGSVDYMSPEQAIGKVQDIDGRSDIFGLGATLYHILSGRPVHIAPGDALLLIAAATKQAAPLATYAPHVPPTLCAVVDRALAKEKHERYPDAATMRADVVAVRAAKPPPYVTAIAEGRIAPGAPFSRR
ncbi:MAG: serine/threonine-protein kinase [Polyangiaceae bacterium]